MTIRELVRILRERAIIAEADGDIEGALQALREIDEIGARVG